jgi:hypothetical protein
MPAARVGGELVGSINGSFANLLLSIAIRLTISTSSLRGAEKRDRQNSLRRWRHICAIQQYGNLPEMSGKSANERCNGEVCGKRYRAAWQMIS